MSDGLTKHARYARSAKGRARAERNSAWKRAYDRSRRRLDLQSAAAAAAQSAKYREQIQRLLDLDSPRLQHLDSPHREGAPCH